MSIRIAIFDDNKNIRNSITMLLSTDLSFEVVGTFRDAEDCVRKVTDCKAEVVLMDIEMPGINGIDAVRQIKASLPHIMILIQTVFEDEDRIFESIRAGASGYILKSFLTQTLTSAIKELQAGGAPMTPLIARKVLQSIYYNPEEKGSTPKTTVEYNLTAKEKEVLSGIVNGLSYKMIAAELNISYETVRSHMKKIYEKLHVASLTEAVAKAIKQRIV
jgi:DNA-binding NarL/FixJ family response regulator